MKKPKLKKYKVSILHEPMIISATNEERAVEEACERVDGQEPRIIVEEI